MYIMSVFWLFAVTRPRLLERSAIPADVLKHLTSKSCSNRKKALNAMTGHILSLCLSHMSIVYLTLCTCDISSFYTK